MPDPEIPNGLAPPAGRPFPWHCPRCRREAVRPQAVPYEGECVHDGRTYRVAVPNLVVPVCAHCGERVFNYSAEQQIAKALQDLVAASASGRNGEGNNGGVNCPMTPYHAAYYAQELTRRSGTDNIARIGSSLFNATVDLNPHQLDAALFAFRAPLSRGAILADEVGLGKTIEAGLVISQLWAEHKRRVLVIAPAILRKQWAQELRDKFFLDSRVIDTREFNAARRAGASALQPADRVVIASYHFAAARRADLAAVPWDLVVIDEAHRLRNVYKTSAKIANAIKAAVHGRPLLLLTATPLQNDLLELYGLVSFIDEHVFGDIEAFKARYKRGPIEERQFEDLRSRLRPLCQRTLRRQVVEYVSFTNRIPITQDFTPTPEEQQLYDQVSEYLRRDKLHALPAGQRKLMTLVLRKLLASSSFAIADTLRTLADRLRQAQPAPAVETADVEVVEDTYEAQQVVRRKRAVQLVAAGAGSGGGTLDDFETLDDLTEEWGEEPASSAGPDVPELDAEVEAEVRELESYSRLADSIRDNAKGRALSAALRQGFAKLQELGAARKAVIFTESRRTQEYLYALLQDDYAGRVLTINGTNADDRSSAIYREWVQCHQGEDAATGNKTVDLRAALVEYFRDHADILIATEAAAEGVNLQFCSLVVNYDLPWNPQRIEQRIGRCHRYGQQYDVVVVNFLNRGNAADERVFELLSEKFRLFEGVFGSSDEVLGALESGVDFERRIAEIYQACRTRDEIDRAFAALRTDLSDQITARMVKTREQLLEHFDEEVHQRLKINHEAGTSYLERAERWLWNLTRHELDGHASFNPRDYSFDLSPLGPGWPDVPPGRYRFVTRTRQAEGQHAFRLGHELAQAVISRAKTRALRQAHIRFDYSARHGRIGAVAELVGHAGWLTLARLTVRALEEEDRLLFAAFDERDGSFLHPDTCAKLFEVGGQVLGLAEPPAEALSALADQRVHLHDRAVAEIGERDQQFFVREIDKLDRWADDLKNGLELELKDLNGRIRQVGREAKLAPDLQNKVTLQKQKKDLEKERKEKQRTLYDAEDEIEAKKDVLIAEVEQRLQQTVTLTDLFTIRWEVV